MVSDYFTPSGFMGDGEKPGALTVGINKECKTPRPANAVGDCYHFLYTIGELEWAGAYWVYPSNSWGTVPGRALIPPRDLGPDGMGGQLYGYTRVRFWAAMDPMPNPPKLHYSAGGIEGSKAKPPQPYGDKGCQIYPPDPTDPTSMRQVFCGVDFQVLDDDKSYISTEWKQFEMPLDRWGITSQIPGEIASVIGAFSFSINDKENLGLPLSIYLDDIVWE